MTFQLYTGTLNPGNPSYLVIQQLQAQVDALSSGDATKLQTLLTATGWRNNVNPAATIQIIRRGLSAVANGSAPVYATGAVSLDGVTGLYTAALGASSSATSFTKIVWFQAASGIVHYAQYFFVSDWNGGFSFAGLSDDNGQGRNGQPIAVIYDPLEDFSMGDPGNQVPPAYSLPVLNDGADHCWISTFNSTLNKFVEYLDRDRIIFGDGNGTPSPFDFSKDLNIGFGGQVVGQPGQGPLIADKLGDFWFGPGVSIADGTGIIIPSATLDKIQTGSFGPVDLGANGELLTGSSPSVFLHLDGADTNPANWATNRGTDAALSIIGVSYTCGINSGSPIVQYPSGILATLQFQGGVLTYAVGKGISGTGIPINAKILSCDAGTGQITMDMNATADNASVDVAFGGTLGYGGTFT